MYICRLPHLIPSVLNLFKDLMYMALIAECIYVTYFTQHSSSLP